jgi:hypothetical protein
VSEVFVWQLYTTNNTICKPEEIIHSLEVVNSDNPHAQQVEIHERHFDW